MALISADKMLDTIIAWIEVERPVYDTIIDLYYTNRRLNLFLGRRAIIPESSIPAIEVSAIDDVIGWHACRVQQVEPSIQIDITTDNRDPHNSVRLQTALVTLTTRILASPIHLLPQIEGTNTHLYDSLPGAAKYDQTAQNGAQRVATISWKGKYIEYLANRMFLPYLQMAPPRVEFPPV